VLDKDAALGKTVVEDFAEARVLDRMLMYERRIESSLYRMMAELRREREARAAAAGPEGVPHSEQRTGGKPRKEATEVPSRPPAATNPHSLAKTQGTPRRQDSSTVPLCDLGVLARDIIPLFSTTCVE
jgi:hypothetical protein